MLNLLNPPLPGMLGRNFAPRQFPEGPPDTIKNFSKIMTPLPIQNGLAPSLLQIRSQSTPLLFRPVPSPSPLHSGDVEVNTVRLYKASAHAPTRVQCAGGDSNTVVV